MIKHGAVIVEGGRQELEVFVVSMVGKMGQGSKSVKLMVLALSS
jgi:hypothetical protein